MAEFRFTYLSGALQGHIETTETTPIVLGRDESCQVKLDKHKDLAVSGQHAQVDMVREGAYQLSNLSRNGSWINGVLVEEAAPLPNHSVIQLGRDGPRVRFDVDENVGGISFAAVKQKTARLQRGVATPAPETEERPIFKIDDVAPTKSSGHGLGGLPIILVVVAAALVLLVAVVFVVLRAH